MLTTIREIKIFKRLLHLNCEIALDFTFFIN